MSRIAKVIAELVGVWVAVGYLSLWAFCNYTGTPLPAGLGVERYLQETYLLLLDRIISGFERQAPLLLLMLVVCFVALLGLDFRRLASRLVELGYRFKRWALFGCLLATAFVFGWANRFLAHLGERPALVGKLGVIPAEPSLLFYSALALALAGLLACSYLLHDSSDQWSMLPRAGKYALLSSLFFFSTALLLYVPILHGFSLSKKGFFVVRLDLDGRPPNERVCAVRLLESSSQMVYWRADHATGHIASVPSSKIKGVDYLGSVELPELVGKAVDGAAEPDCGSENLGGAK